MPCDVNVVKLGKKGQVSIPRSTSRALGIGDEQMLTVEISGDGAIVPRPAGVYRIELYDDARIAECLAEDELPAEFAIEARRNMAGKRMDGRHDLDDVLGSADVAADSGPAVLAWASRYVMAKDAPILAAAIASHADVLVRGDRRHFGELFGRTVHGVRVESPRTALTIVFDGGW